MMTVTILTKNSARTLEKTLRSVAGFDEVIVYDTGSADDTKRIAHSFAYVTWIDGYFNGFGATHNRVSALAKNDWILSIDSDEELSTELQNLLLTKKLSPQTVYELPRHNFFHGKWIRTCSGWYPDPVIRLYHRKYTYFSDDEVHEKILSRGMQVESLPHPLFHTPYLSLHDFLQKMQHYSDLFCQQNKGKKRVSFPSALLHGWFAFFKSYILKRGFLQGKEGWIISLYQGHVSYYKYLKLWEAHLTTSTK